ncbi:hypothetical protein FRC17_003948, partial [Serendipita sp. 399]
MLRPIINPSFTTPAVQRYFIRANLQRWHKRTPSRSVHGNSQTDQTPRSGDREPDGPEVSDAEWEIRAGRAIALVRETLPDFFKVGLVEYSTDDENAESIYSPRIQLLYTPPARLPPFPPTLHIEGLPLYHASSMFVRHTLSMFYTDISIELTRMNDVKGSSRDRKFTIGTAVFGKSRMGGTRAEWDV